jgi:hypothetical protein
MKVAAMNATEIQASVITDIRAMEAELAAISRNLRGDRSMAKRQYPTGPSVIGRVESIVYGLWDSSASPTETMKNSLRQAEQDFDPIYEKIKKIGETDMVALAQKLDAAGSPYVPGKLPEWK